jgi:ribosomal protein S18 acetylase RimI-like enzyme
MAGFVQDAGRGAWQPCGMLPLSRLPPADAARLRRLVAEDPLLSFYLALAEAEAARGEDASFVLLGRARGGAALGARFDGLTVFSTAGVLEADDLRRLLRWPGRLELHLTAAHHALLAGLPARGLGPPRHMLAMQAPAEGAAADPDAVLLDWAGFAEAAAMMAAHNPETVLSARMAALPFVAIREGGRIIALAGTIGVAEGTALVGHFLTLPEAHGRGLARRLARHLRWHFARQGLRRLLLATTEDNRAACRAYRSAGFSVSGWRWQLGREEGPCGALSVGTCDDGPEPAAR